VILVASRSEDPRSVLFGTSHPEPVWEEDASLAFGFYWTEGLRGLGAAIDAVPTLKGGSTIGIPSPPAILLPFGKNVVTPEIRDAERLQGFSPDWTLPASIGNARAKNSRWRLIGNAISVPVATWLGEQLASPRAHFSDFDLPFRRSRRKWPNAAWGRKNETYFVDVTTWPEKLPYQHLHQFLEFPATELSARATAGFLARLNKGSLTCYPPDFKSWISQHLDRMNVGNVA
jgi:DNA (cytosine-5)-methyltransferase 1